MRTQPHNGLSLLRGSFMENKTNLNSNGKYQIRLKFSTYRRRSNRLESCPRISILCRVFQRQNKVYSYQTNKKKCYPALLLTVHDLWWLKSSHNAILSLRHGFQSNLPSSSDWSYIIRNGSRALPYITTFETLFQCSCPKNLLAGLLDDPKKRKQFFNHYFQNHDYFNLFILTRKFLLLTDRDYPARQSLQFIRGLQGFTDTTPPTVFVGGNCWPNYQEVVTRYPLCGSSELLHWGTIYSKLWIDSSG